MIIFIEVDHLHFIDKANEKTLILLISKSFSYENEKEMTCEMARIKFLQ